MDLLQLGRERLRPSAADRLTRSLCRAVRDADQEGLSGLIAEGERTRDRQPNHFGLTFALGLADERLAALRADPLAVGVRKRLHQLSRTTATDGHAPGSPRGPVAL